MIFWTCSRVSMKKQLCQACRRTLQEIWIAFPQSSWKTIHGALLRFAEAGGIGEVVGCHWDCELQTQSHLWSAGCADGHCSWCSWEDWQHNVLPRGPTLLQPPTSRCCSLHRRRSVKALLLCLILVLVTLVLHSSWWSTAAGQQSSLPSAAQWHRQWVMMEFVLFFRPLQAGCIRTHRLRLSLRLTNHRGEKVLHWSSHS